MKNLFLLSLLLACGCVNHIPADSTSVSLGSVGADLDSVTRTADAGAKRTTDSADKNDFTNISKSAAHAKIGVGQAETNSADQAKKLANAEDTAKLRDSFIPIAWGGLIAGVLLIAAWSYFKIDLLEYFGVGCLAASLGSVALYLAIATIQTAMPWILGGVGLISAAFVIRWFIQNRNTTNTQLVASAHAAMTLPVAVALKEMDKIQNPTTQAIVDKVQAANPSLATPAVAGGPSLAGSVGGG
jgi:hypothetical protein